MTRLEWLALAAGAVFFFGTLYVGYIMDWPLPHPTDRPTQSIPKETP